MNLLTTLHIVETMHERKKMMFELCEAAIILPGGFGTMDELFEMITWNQLSIHDKTIVLFNSDGYYNNLLAHFSKCKKKDFYIRRGMKVFLQYVDPKELISLMV